MSVNNPSKQRNGHSGGPAAVAQQTIPIGIQTPPNHQQQQVAAVAAAAAAVVQSVPPIPLMLLPHHNQPQPQPPQQQQQVTQLFAFNFIVNSIVTKITML